MKKRGVTLLETVISMTIVLIITFMIMQTVIKGKDSEKIITRDFVCANEIENQHSMFQYATDKIDDVDLIIERFINLADEMYFDTQRHYDIVNLSDGAEFNFYYDVYFNSVDVTKAVYVLKSTIQIIENEDDYLIRQYCSVRNYKTKILIYTVPDYEVRV